MKQVAFHRAVMAVLLVGAHAGAAVAEEFPKRKPGLWEMKTTGGPVGAQTMQQCIDAKTDDLLRNESLEGQKCSKPVVRRQGSTYQVGLSCVDPDGSRSTIDSTYVMTGDSAYRGDMKMRFTPPMNGVAEMNMKVDGKWLGACKPGMKPGDVAIRGMPAINPLNMGKDGTRMSPEEARRMAEEMLKSLGRKPGN